MAITSSAKALVHKLGSYYTKELCRREFLAQQFLGINERPIEYRFVFENLTAAYPKTVLDVGTGKTALPQLLRTCGCLVTAIDNVSDYWPSGMVNRHYHVLDDDILEPKIKGPFDFITCISTLEHIPNHTRALKMMFSLLRPGGRLVITCPYNESAYAENVYALPGSIGADKYAFITQAFSRKEVDQWLRENNAEIITQEYWRLFEGPFWTIGNRVIPPLRVDSSQLHQISCLALSRGPATSVKGV
jgi:2-polyprenyl-3-methyl-5-hydroxy-6-metoxy-1,4-benzoquinol methylase